MTEINKYVPICPVILCTHSKSPILVRGVAFSPAKMTGVKTNNITLLAKYRISGTNIIIIFRIKIWDF